MNVKYRELMQRAIGIIEGVALCSEKAQQEALYTAVEMLDSALKKEEVEDEQRD